MNFTKIAAISFMPKANKKLQFSLHSLGSKRNIPNPITNVIGKTPVSREQQPTLTNSIILALN
jgi:hypothetical protein